MFFKDLMEEQKESHRVEMADLRKSLKEESDRIINQMEETHKTSHGAHEKRVEKKQLLPCYIGL